MVEKCDITEKVINLLNDALERDRKTITTLVKNRVVCNESLANHPTIICSEENGKPYLGFVGILNGILKELGQEKIASRWSGFSKDEDGNPELLDFVL